MRTICNAIRNIYSGHEETLRIVDENLRAYEVERKEDFSKEITALLLIRSNTLKSMQELVEAYPHWIDEG